MTVAQDADGDGLIGIHTPAQLDAVRHDLDGDGAPTTAGAAGHAAVFEVTGGGTLSCAVAGGRRGYELRADVAERRGRVDIAIASLLSDAGLRRSEAAAVTWADIARAADGPGHGAPVQNRSGGPGGHPLRDHRHDGRLRRHPPGRAQRRPRIWIVGGPDRPAHRSSSSRRAGGRLQRP